MPWRHLLWIFDVDSRAEAMQRLEGFRLDGVVQKIACPFLLVHGEGDEQIRRRAISASKSLIEVCIWHTDAAVSPTPAHVLCAHPRDALDVAGDVVRARSQMS